MPKNNLLDMNWSLLFLVLGHMTKPHSITADCI